MTGLAERLVIVKAIKTLFVIIRVLLKTHSGLVLENLALRQQLAVLKSSAKCPRHRVGGGVAPSDLPHHLSITHKYHD